MNECKLLPKEPTPEMIDAVAGLFSLGFANENMARGVYYAMYRAAPDSQTGAVTATFEESCDFDPVPKPAPGGARECASGQPFWIDVNDRLPEPGQLVLVYRPDAPKTQDPVIRTAYYGLHGRTGRYGFNCYLQPSLWMPIPPVCLTCSDRGLVGGFVGPESGYQTDPCPDCQKGSV